MVTCLFSAAIRLARRAQQDPRAGWPLTAARLSSIFFLPQRFGLLGVNYQAGGLSFRGRGKLWLLVSLVRPSG